MPKNFQLTVKPLNAWNLSKIVPHSIQVDDKVKTQGIFKKGFPAHQAMFYEGRKSILACGLIDISDDQYYLWTLFSKNVKSHHLVFIYNYLNNYLSLLNYRSIHHIIRKDFPNSRRMMRLMGFEYVRDEEENLEHWVRI